MTIDIEAPAHSSHLVDEARQAMRAKRSRAEWLPVYERVLAEAHARRDTRALAELTVLATARLLGTGATRDAIAQLDFGIANAQDAPAQLLHLLCVKASVVALDGDPAAGQSLMKQARLLLRHVKSPRQLVEADVYASTVDCIAIGDADLTELEAPVGAANRAGLPWLASGLMAWVIPWLGAVGQARDALPRVDTLAVQARSAGHSWRVEDADSFTAALRALTVLEPDSRVPELGDNPMARWRAAAVKLRTALLAADWPSAQEWLLILGAAQEQLPPGFREGVSCYHALLAAYRDDAVPDDLDPPPSLTLNNLGATLAGIEAAAIAGTQEQAVRWYRWSHEHLPRHVRSSLEWPVAVDRVLALIAARVGAMRESIRLARRAAKWSDEAGYVVENAIARVQLAEILAFGSRDVSEREWRNRRRDARGVTSDLGIDPVPHAYAATRCLALGRSSTNTPRLSVREVEVLRLMASGMSYREAGEELGIGWRTVQTHAHRIYEKLSVSGKVLALARARELGIL